MSSIRANPERVKLLDPPRPMRMALVTGMVGGEYLMPPMGRETEFENMPRDNIEYMTFSALIAEIEPWGAVRYGDDDEPEAVFKSEYLFLPISHCSVLERFRKHGPTPIAFEFWAQPAGNVRGYSWYLHNLAKYDRNISPVERLFRLGVQPGRQD